MISFISLSSFANISKRLLNSSNISFENTEFVAFGSGKLDSKYLIRLSNPLIICGRETLLGAGCAGYVLCLLIGLPALI